MSLTAWYQTASTTTSASSGSPTWPARASPGRSAASACAFSALVPSRVTAWPPSSARVAMPRAMLPVPMMVMSMGGSSSSGYRHHRAGGDLVDARRDEVGAREEREVADRELAHAGGAGGVRPLQLGVRAALLGA